MPALLDHLTPPALCVITFGRSVVMIFWKNLPFFGWVLLWRELNLCLVRKLAFWNCILFFSKKYTKIYKNTCGSSQTSMIIQASHLSAPGPMSQRSSLPTRVPVQVSTLERWMICDQCLPPHHYDLFGINNVTLLMAPIFFVTLTL